MRINTRFPVAVHILALIGFLNDGTCTSELLGRSVATNPVVIRRLIALLKKAGFIEVKMGVGGATLARDPERISLRDVYRAVQASEDAVVFDMHQNPNPCCFVGAGIHAALAAPLAKAQEAMEDALAAFSIRDIMDEIRKTGRAP